MWKMLHKSTRFVHTLVEVLRVLIDYFKLFRLACLFKPTELIDFLRRFFLSVSEKLHEMAAITHRQVVFE
jgi:hypothetical protein